MTNIFPLKLSITKYSTPREKEEKTQSKTGVGYNIHQIYNSNVSFCGFVNEPGWLLISQESVCQRKQIRQLDITATHIISEQVIQVSVSLKSLRFVSRIV